MVGKLGRIPLDSLRIGGQLGSTLLLDQLRPKDGIVRGDRGDIYHSKGRRGCSGWDLGLELDLLAGLTSPSIRSET